MHVAFILCPHWCRGRPLRVNVVFIGWVSVPEVGHGVELNSRGLVSCCPDLRQITQLCCTKSARVWCVAPQG